MFSVCSRAPLLTLLSRESFDFKIQRASPTVASNQIDIESNSSNIDGLFMSRLKATMRHKIQKKNCALRVCAN